MEVPKGLKSAWSVLNATKMSGKLQFIPGGVPLFFSPVGDPYATNDEHPEWEKYVTRMSEIHTGPGVIAGHLAKIKNSGRSIFVDPRGPGCTIVTDRLPVARKTTTKNLSKVLAAMSSSMMGTSLVAVGSMWYQSALNAGVRSALRRVFDVVDEVRIAPQGGVGYTLPGNFSYGGLVNGDMTHRAMLPTPGYFKVWVRANASSSPMVYADDLWSVFMIPVDEDEVICALDIRVYTSPQSGNMDMHMDPRPYGTNSLAGMSASCVPYTHPGANNGQAVIKFRSGFGNMFTAGAFGNGSSTWADLPLSDTMPYVASSPGWNNFTTTDLYLSGPVYWRERLDRAAAFAGVSSEALIRSSDAFGGLYRVGTDRATSTVAEAIRFPTCFPDFTYDSFSSRAKFRRVADAVDNAFPDVAEIDGIVGKLRLNPDSYFHAYVQLDRVLRPMRDPLMGTDMYRKAIEAGEDIRARNMLESDPDDANSRPVTFGQANAKANSFYDKPRSSYLATQSAPRPVRSGGLQFSYEGGKIVIREVGVGLIEPDDAYVVLAQTSISNHYLAPSIVTHLASLPAPVPAPVSYPADWDKLCMALYNDSYGAITVASPSGQANDISVWDAPVKAGFLRSPSVWPAEYWLSWAAGGTQAGMSLVGGVLTSPSGTGTYERDPRLTAVVIQ